MRSTVGRSLNMCFNPSGTATESSSFPPEDLSRPLPNPITTAATAAASISLIKNFNSVYDHNFDSTSHSKSLISSDSDCSSTDSDADTTVTPDLAAVFASQRFFFSSPGRSNSIVDSSSLSSSSSSATAVDLPESDKIVGGSLAVPTYSQDPFHDFRQSMQEMVEARELVDVRADWDHLQELLTCYLTLNPKSAHKFIIRAFSDLLVSMMPSLPTKNIGPRFAGKRRL